MTERQKDLCKYRLSQSDETLESARLCLQSHYFRDAVNRSYYAAFYAVKAVLALEGTDFKRHKEVVAYFNQQYVASGKVERNIGRLLSRLQKKREASDYDDFFIVSSEEAMEQIDAATRISEAIKKYLGQLIGQF